MPCRFGQAVAVILALTISATSSAQNNEEAAGAAYERGRAAFEQKDYALATKEFALADELAPSSAALESALKAALLADDPLLGMDLAARSQARKSTSEVIALGQRAIKAFEDRAGQISVRCPATHQSCTVAIDETPQVPGKTVWVRVGMRSVTVTMDGQARTEQVEVRPGRPVEFVPGTPQVPDRSLDLGTRVGPPPPTQRGISPVFFIVTAATTAALTGVTIWSGVDTLSYHDDFQSGIEAAKTPGQSAQTRTNVLFATTAGGFAASFVLIFVTDFGGDPEPRSSGTQNAVRLSSPF